MKTRGERVLAALAICGLVAWSVAPVTTSAADDSGGSSMTDKAKAAGSSAKDAAENAGSAVKNSAKSAAGYATDSAKNATARVQGKDTLFVRKAAIGGLAEVQSAELAKTKASSAEVKSFAEHMISDHGKANDELAALAKEKGITVPTELDNAHQAKLDKLKGLSGDAFDKEYVKQQRMDHAATLKLLQDEAKNGKDPDLKSFAAKTKTVVSEHKSRIDKIGGTAKAGSRRSGAAS